MFTGRYEEYRDKRKYYRHPVELVGEIRRDESDSSEAYHKITDISLEGLAFYSNISFSEGEELVVKIPFEDSSFDCRARVVWKRASQGRYDIGLELSGLDRAAADEMVIKAKRGNKELWGRAKVTQSID